jgi:hypothetical protein
MPYDSQGTYSLPAGSIVQVGDKVLPSQHNPPLQDISSCLSSVLVRDGRNGMVGPLDMGSFPIRNVVDGSDPQDVATVGQLAAAITKLTTPAGKIGYFMLGAAPDGWIEANGGTIGNVSSGATTRASADTIDLFTALWTDFTDAELPILTSAGAASARGATAALDFAANKRLTIHELRGEFLRGWDHGRGIDTGRAVGSAQAEDFKSHTHTGTTASAGAHTHTIPGQILSGNGTSMVGPDGRSGDWFKNNSSTNSAGNHTHLFTTDATGGAETRPRNVAALVCLKL